VAAPQAAAACSDEIRPDGRAEARRPTAVPASEIAVRTPVPRVAPTATPPHPGEPGAANGIPAGIPAAVGTSGLLADDFERAVIDRLYDGVYYVDRARRIRYWNQGAERIAGYSSSDMVGRFCYDNLLNHVDASGRQLCRSVCPLAATIRDGQPREVEVYLRHREGHRVPVQVRTAPVHDREGRVIGAVEIFDESTDLARARHEVAELRDLAMRDGLTGVPNRRHFEMTIASRIAERAGYGRPFGLLIADIDKFKDVNDRHGHVVGDMALRAVARTLLSASRPGDDVARFGGEEFALTLADVDAGLLGKIAERFRALVERTLVLAEEGALSVTVSIGGAIARHGESAESIIDRADAALYEAKRAGRNRIQVASETPES
jgi:diguanylate cyclase (GGDEF)-like protein/PAS domain S-box-containing protein